MARIPVWTGKSKGWPALGAVTLLSSVNALAGAPDGRLFDSGESAFSVQSLTAVTPSWGIFSCSVALLVFAFAFKGLRRFSRSRLDCAAQIALQRLIINHASEAMMLTDAAQRIVSVNAAFERTTGYSAEEVVGRTPTMLSADQQGLNVHRNIWDFVAEHGDWSGEVWDRRKDGAIYPKQLRVRAIFDTQGLAAHFVAAFSDTSEAKAQAERFDYLARHDQLTLLPNRLALDKHLGDLLDSAVPGINHLVLLIIDLDHFKTVNDSLGHPAGDRLLADIARRLGAEMDRTKRLFRLGGDEFVVVAEQIEGHEALERLVHCLSRAIAMPCDVDGHVLHSTASIGVSRYPDDGRSAQALIRNADTAMYAAKAAGRNTHCLFAEPMNAAANKRLHLESELWRALADNELILHYQPQIDLLSGKVVGVEALVRWRHPQRGLIAPAEFIPVAEECGLILPLGHWVLRTACRQVKAWLDAGIDMGEMAVNISAHQFRQPEFAQLVRAVLAETGVEPERLELEITESTIMHGVDSAIQTMAQLRAAGVRLAIDDFGTGYSSLSYLRRFPLDRLKIDRSFLADVDTDPDARALLTSIVMLGRSLGLQLVAEGVESFAQAEFLRTLECERVQGFHFHQPVSAEEVVDVGDFEGCLALPA